jgi:polyhydroxybutyrate depolymerase
MGRTGACIPLLVVALLSGSAAWANCAAPDAMSGRVSLDVGGVSRSFVLRMPSAGNHAAAPVLFAFHPYGMNASYMQARAPIPRAWPEAIVLYPEGSGFPPSWQNRPLERSDRDLHFFDAMLAWLHQHACIDDARVFVMGYSNGAALAYTIACSRATLVAAVAIASGRLGCIPSASTAIIIRHGTRDDTIGYTQAITASQAFSKANRCEAPPQGNARGCVEATDCAAARVVLCTDEGGHEYNPSFTATAVDFFRGARR